MSVYEDSLKVLKSEFGKDRFFAFATASMNVPSVRMVDTFYDDGKMYIVVSGKTQKVREVEANPNVALCFQMTRFSGKAYNLGHPLLPENKDIREKLIVAFKPWYFEHNCEDGEMYVIKIVLESGFFYKDGIGYTVDFVNKSATSIPFEFE